MFVSLAPANFPRLAAITLDAGVLGFSLVVAVLAGVIAGLAPAIHLLRSDLNSVIRAGGSRGATAGRARSASRLLVISEVALALALVTTAGLMVKSLMRLQSQDLGVTRAPMLTFGVGVPPFVANGNDAVRRFQLEFLQKVRALPGVTRRSAISLLPIAAHRHQRSGPPHRSDRRQRRRARHGVPHRHGRLFRDHGHADAGGRVARRARSHEHRLRRRRQRNAGQAPVPDARPSAVVGQQIRLFGNNGPASEIVGVAANVRSRRPDMVAGSGSLRGVRTEPVAEHELRGARAG